MMESIIRLLLVTSAATVAVEGRILCPEIGLLGTPTNLTCTEASRSHSFNTPSGTSATACEISTGKCISTGNFSASVINTTSSVLTIPALLESHAGRWKCSSDGDILDPPSCLMTVAKFPTCNITGRHYADVDFTVDEEVALKVNVTRYYCSGSVQFRLQTGDIKTDLNSSQWITNTDVIFNLTESHIGEVKLIFICGGYRQTSPCEGIQQLRTGSSPMDGNHVSTTTCANTADSTGFLVPVCSVGVLLPLAIVISSLIFWYKRRHKHRTSRTVNTPPSLMSGDAGYSTICVVDGAFSWANITNRSLPPTPEVQGTMTNPGCATVAEGAVSKANTLTADTTRAEGPNPIVNSDDDLVHVKSALSASVGDSGSPPPFDSDIKVTKTFENKVLNSDSQSQSSLFQDPGYSSLGDVIVTRSRPTSVKASCTGGTSPVVIPEGTHENDCSGATPDVSELYAKVVKTKDTTEPVESGVSVVVLK